MERLHEIAQARSASPPQLWGHHSYQIFGVACMLIMDVRVTRASVILHFLVNRTPVNVSNRTKFNVPSSSL